MKHFLLVWLFLTVVTPLVAQDSVKLARREYRAEVWSDMRSLPRSQFRAGVGLRLGAGRKVLMDDSVAWVRPTYGTTTQIFSLEYSCRVWSFLEVGLSAAYTRYAMENYQDLTTNGWVGSFTGDALNVAVLVRYSWFNRPWVSLYSSLGMWGEVAFERSTLRGKMRSSSTQLRIYPDVSPIGVRVGKRFFGYFEPFCFGARGAILQVGLGCKF